MPRITKIQNERKYPYRAAIYVDQQFHMQIDPEVVYSFGLREGQEICEEKLKEIAARDAYLEGRSSIAISSISSKDQGRSEKLKRRF